MIVMRMWAINKRNAVVNYVELVDAPPPNPKNRHLDRLCCSLRGRCAARVQACLGWPWAACVVLLVDRSVRRPPRRDAQRLAALEVWWTSGGGLTHAGGGSKLPWIISGRGAASGGLGSAGSLDGPVVVVVAGRRGWWCEPVQEMAAGGCAPAGGARWWR